MLLKYSVSNFKSIGNNVEFSMFPLEDNTDERFLNEIDTVDGKWRVLKRGALFGPNASGKTSFVQSLAYARNYIVKGPRNNAVTKVPQFRGEIEELEGETTFEFMMYIDGKVYDYGFSLNRTAVSEEWLELYTKDGFTPMFKRVTDGKKVSEIEIFSKYARKKSKIREIAELLKDTIKEKQADQLFLYKLYENGSPVASLIYEWFDRIQILYPDTKLQSLPLRLQKDEQFRKFLSDQLNILDTGIENVYIENQSIDLADFSKKFNLPHEMIHDIEEKQNGLFIFNGKYYLFTERGTNTKLVQLKFEHSLNGNTVDFDIDDESDGTRRLLDLLPILFKLRKDENRVYIIDEIDRSLHTKLSRYFVEKFVKFSGNTQLVFTAHDTNLLDSELFRQEEIWFVEKMSSGETKLRPYSDFDQSMSLDIINDYLSGRLGAVPVIREKKIWQDQE